MTPREAERWITPQGHVCIVYEHDFDRIRGEILVNIPTFHFLLEAAGYIRVDNLEPSQVTER